jgi:hypothetical protein
MHFEIKRVNVVHPSSLLCAVVNASVRRADDPGSNPAVAKRRRINNEKLKAIF